MSDNTVTTGRVVMCAYCGFVYDPSEFCCPWCQQQEYEEVADDTTEEVSNV